MKNLKNALQAQTEKRTQEFLKELRKEKTIEDILKQWRFTDLIPKGSSRKFATVKELKEYLTIRREKQDQNSLKKELVRVDLAAEADDVINISIGVEWKKSRMWGSNPTATVEIRTKNGNFERYIGTTSGCGYDKESAAIATALNQSNAVLKLLYKLKNKQADGKNGEVIGYGAGYGILPAFEGGVGFDCHRRIFEKLGFKTERTASGKTFDAYTIRK